MKFTSPFRVYYGDGIRTFWQWMLVCCSDIFFSCRQVLGGAKIGRGFLGCALTTCALVSVFLSNKIYDYYNLIEGSAEGKIGGLCTYRCWQRKAGLQFSYYESCGAQSVTLIFPTFLQRTNKYHYDRPPKVWRNNPTVSLHYMETGKVLLKVCASHYHYGHFATIFPPPCTVTSIASLLYNNTLLILVQWLSTKFVSQITILCNFTHIFLHHRFPIVLSISEISPWTSCLSAGALLIFLWESETSLQQMLANAPLKWL